MIMSYKIYDKISIKVRALSIFIVLGLFMTALVIGYGAYLGNSGSGIIPVSGKEDKKAREEAEVFEERERVPREFVETEEFNEVIE